MKFHNLEIKIYALNVSVSVPTKCNNIHVWKGGYGEVTVETKTSYEEIYVLETRCNYSS